MNRLLLVFLVSLLAACSTSPESRSWLTYRIDVRQGNMVTQEMAAQLKLGQTKDQVRFILGTPLVADAFHADRWDYVYRFQPGRDTAEAERSHLSVYFEKGILIRVDGSALAVGSGTDAQIKPAPRVIDIAPASGSTN
jgi:outer membrane protein assembly factor BamE